MNSLSTFKQWRIASSKGLFAANHLLGAFYNPTLAYVNPRRLLVLLPVLLLLVVSCEEDDSVKPDTVDPDPLVEYPPTRVEERSEKLPFGAKFQWYTIKIHRSYKGFKQGDPESSETTWEGFLHLLYGPHNEQHAPEHVWTPASVSLWLDRTLANMQEIPFIYSEDAYRWPEESPKTLFFTSQGSGNFQMCCVGNDPPEDMDVSWKKSKAVEKRAIVREILGINPDGSFNIAMQLPLSVAQSDYSATPYDEPVFGSDTWSDEDGGVRFRFVPDSRGQQQVIVQPGPVNSDPGSTYRVEIEPLYSEIEVRIRVFIPSEAMRVDDLVGPIFSGDKRGFSYSYGTNRVIQNVVVALKPDEPFSVIGAPYRAFGITSQYEVDQGAPMAGQPWWFWGIKAGQTTLNKTQLPITDENNSISVMRNGDAVKINTLIDGGVPAVSVPIRLTAPNINAEFEVEIRQTKGQVAEFRVKGEHDGFPAYELYINGISVYLYDPVLQKADPINLLPPMDQDVLVDWTPVPY